MIRLTITILLLFSFYSRMQLISTRASQNPATIVAAVCATLPITLVSSVTALSHIMVTYVSTTVLFVWIIQRSAESMEYVPSKIEK